MKIPAAIRLVIPVLLLFAGCRTTDELKEYNPKTDPEIGFINGRLVPRKCGDLAISPKVRTHRVFTLPSFSYVGVKVDLGKMDLDPKLLEPVTETLIALSWGRQDLCLSVKQRATGPSEEHYQQAWDKYMQNTKKLSQFALIALSYRPAAAQPGKAKPASTSKKLAKTEPATKKLVDAVGKWLESYGERVPARAPASAASTAESPETQSEKLKRLRHELIHRPAKSDSEVGL
jgi:hypothetical protein